MNEKIGITSFGAYIPRLRLDRMAIFQSMGWFAPATVMVAQGERSMCNWDEDSLTMAVAASRDCLTGMDKAAIEVVTSAIETVPHSFVEPCTGFAAHQVIKWQRYTALLQLVQGCINGVGGWYLNIHIHFRVEDSDGIDVGKKSPNGGAIARPFQPKDRKGIAVFAARNSVHLGLARHPLFTWQGFV